VDNDNADIESEAIGRCIRALGTSSFHRRLLNIAKAVCGIEHLSVFSFSESLVPTVEVLEGLVDPSVTRQSAKSYLGMRYFLSDPAAAKAHSSAFHADTVTVFVLRIGDIHDAAYRRDIYERFGLDGRISLIGQVNGHWRSINFYPRLSTGGMTANTIKALKSRAPLLFAAEARHIELTHNDDRAETRHALPSLEFLQRLLQSVAPEFSRREVDVCARGLRGMTGEETARELRITEATVATLRRRAYMKLGISTLNELFALCLAEAGAQSVRRNPSDRSLDPQR
jgi:DNA-binding CsgD family transcriptional regulator